ncbi:NAD(P)H-dependent oxidoreductase [Aurantibacter sp.]|uniref:NAD(P)H-dependent oxidoreductase n=1 Tax=Aurantibacter sp. TaxID=2807103 RepID=UPI0035C86A74
MSIIEALQFRYATKKFDDNKFVSEPDINIIKEAFNLTATSYGLQPIKLIVLKNKSLQSDLVPITMNQEQVAQASHVLVFCIDSKIDANYIETYFNRIKKIRQTPDDILKGFKDYLISDFNTKSQENIELWATNQAYLAMGNLLTVCANLRIDACPMEGFLSNEYDNKFKLKDKDLKSVLVMPIGYRAQDDFMSKLKKVRKPLDEVIIDLS